MKIKSFLFSILAAVAVTFTCSSCSDEPAEHNYAWHLLELKSESGTSSQSTGLFLDWIRNKVNEIENQYGGSGTFKSEEEAIAHADQLYRMLEQAVKDFETASSEFDLGEGICRIRYAISFSKDGDPIKIYPSFNFDYYDPHRNILEKPIKPGDLNELSQITLTLDDFKLEKEVIIDVSGMAEVYNDMDNKRVYADDFLKIVNVDGRMITLTFTDLIGKKGNYHILIPVIFKGSNNEYFKLCIKLDLN